MPFDIPRNEVLPVDSVDVVLDPAPHPFEADHLAAIEANWAEELAANPALYDGKVMLHSDLRYVGRKLVGRCHEVRFATLMYWRRRPGLETAEHAYAHAALVSSDNALVAIRMGQHTASPGAVYFAAGSFEAPDFPGGRVDVDGNMMREVREETGLEIDGIDRDSAYHLYSDGGSTVIIRRYYLAETAGELAERIEQFVAGEAEPEIVGPVIIRSPDDRPQGLKSYMADIIRWHFAG